MHYTVQTVAAPSVEPVSLADVKAYLRINLDDDSEDGLLQSLISSSRSWSEDYTRRKFLATSLVMLCDRFPHPQLEHDRYGQHFYPTIYGPITTYFNPALNCFVLPYSPVSAVSSIKYLNDGDNLATLDPALYVTDLVSQPARVSPLYGQVWPIILPRINSVQVTYTAGMGRALTASTTASSTELTASGLTSADVGQSVSIQGAGANGQTLNALVSSIDVEAGTATMSAPAITAVTNGLAVVGVPEGIKQSIVMLAAIWFESRAYAGTQARSIPTFVEALLYPYRDLSRSH